MADSVLAFAPRMRGVIDATQRPHAGGHHVPQHLLARSERLARYWDLSDVPVRVRLLQRAAERTSPRLTWLLLTLLDRGRPAAWEGPDRLRALERLANADDAMLRFAAYRWLAALHTIDLRCEMLAKRVLLAGVARETGLARRRVEHLLRSC